MGDGLTQTSCAELGLKDGLRVQRQGNQREMWQRAIHRACSNEC